MNFNIKGGGVTSPCGFKASGISTGLKHSGKKDLALIYSEKACRCAAVYTKNIVKGAPLVVTKEHLKNPTAKAVIINSGNANTCTGKTGLKNAESMCECCGNIIGIDSEDVLVASTGVIGVQLDIEKISNSIPKLVENLNENGSKDAATAIMTTDTISKTASLCFDINGKKITIGAMSKGSGMIHPNMATMLAFITTDADISQELLEKALKDSVKVSFNRISVDRDTSTNDMAIIMANGSASNPLIEDENCKEYKTFKAALKFLTVHIAKMMAKDGEGATKLVECKVINSSSEKSAETLAKSVICSNLVKTAMFGCDANWGRILDALGYSGVNFDVNKLKLSIESSKGSVSVFENGNPINFSEELAKEVLSEDEILILVDTADGKYEVSCWGCDLTYDYVKINGSYRS